MKTKLTKNQISGLTLLELLGTIVVIAIIASVAITAIGNSINGSKEGAVRRQAQIFASGYQGYISAGGGFIDVTVTGNEWEDMKNNALTAATALTSPLTTPYGVVGPFAPAEAVSEWTLPNTSLMGKYANGVPHYIGFSPVTGFQYLGPEPTPSP